MNYDCTRCMQFTDDGNPADCVCRELFPIDDLRDGAA